MKRIMSLFVCLAMTSIAFNAEADKPKDYETKTMKLADEFVKSSKEGNFKKTYNALRKIQKFEFRLQKEELIGFYTDLHEAVIESCEKYGIEDSGKVEMRAVIDALFSDELKKAVQ